ncbi:MAG: nitrile hydratase subunit beta [Rhodospirillales bacterium]|nr:nitrile hydratase subunit beta [Rhodospirillales bacterium]
MSFPTLAVGETVIVRASFPPGHTRAPHYVRGRRGVVAGIAGQYPNPEELAYGRSGKPELPLYRVRFHQRDLWDDYRGSADDTVVVEVYANWLERSSEGRP